MYLLIYLLFYLKGKNKEKTVPSHLDVKLNKYKNWVCTT